jgi:hypothetical protein
MKVNEGDVVPTPGEYPELGLENQVKEEKPDFVERGWDGHSVASSHLSYVELNQALGVGRVTFTNGKSYEYSGCTESELEAIVNAPSPGTAFRAIWGDGKKPFLRIQ